MAIILTTLIIQTLPLFTLMQTRTTGSTASSASNSPA